MQIVFLLGSHRTGTKTFANFFKDMFGNHVNSHHQLSSMRWINIFSTMYVEKLMPASAFKGLMHLFLIRRLQQQHSDYYIEVNGFNYIAAHTVKEYFPEVKIVHLIRDPRDFVTSYLNWTHGRWKSRIALNLVPFWNVCGFRVGDISKSKWKSFTTFEKICWYWTYKNETISTLYSGDTDSFLTIRFEDIFNVADCSQHLASLLTFIGLTPSSDYTNYFQTKQNMSHAGYFPHWQDWEKCRCQQLENICGHLMHRYHYGTEAEWINQLR